MTSPNGQFQYQTDTFFVAKDGEAYTQSAKTRPGADCGSDHQLLIAKFRLKLKNTGKNTRPARYDLNKILNEFALDLRE